MDRSKEVVHGPVHEGGPQTRATYFVESDLQKKDLRPQQHHHNLDYLTSLEEALKAPLQYFTVLNVMPKSSGSFYNIHLGLIPQQKN